MIRWQFGFTPINLMQWTLGRSCSRFLFLSRVWLFKRETRLAARFPLLVAKPSGFCARPTRRETTSIGKSNENRQTLCKFHNTTATNCVLCQRRYYSAESNGDAFVSLRVQSIIVLQPNCCQQWNRSITHIDRVPQPTPKPMVQQGL